MGGEDDADTRGGSIEDLPRETMERAWRATRRDGYSAWRGHFARFAVALGITSQSRRTDGASGRTRGALMQRLMHMGATCEKIVQGRDSRWKFTWHIPENDQLDVRANGSHDGDMHEGGEELHEDLVGVPSCRTTTAVHAESSQGGGIPKFEELLHGLGDTQLEVDVDPHSLDEGGSSPGLDVGCGNEMQTLFEEKEIVEDMDDSDTYMSMVRTFVQNASGGVDDIVMHRGGSDITKRDLAVYFLKLKQDSKMSDKTFNAMLPVIEMLSGVEAGSGFPSSLHLCKVEVKVEDAWANAVHVCPKYHKVFDAAGPRDEWNSEETCGIAYKDPKTDEIHVRHIHTFELKCAQLPWGKRKGLIGYGTITISMVWFAHASVRYT